MTENELNNDANLTPEGSVLEMGCEWSPNMSHDAIAFIKGQPYTQLPHDLYIPPDALRVMLETFQGPLDLLLYLIRKQNLDILDIPIAKITEQYVEYIDMMQSMSIELAAEYLVMAAILAHIKSRMLLPRSKEAEAEEDDPRAELIRRLQEYEQIKAASEKLDNLPRLERDCFRVKFNVDQVIDSNPPLAEVDLKELCLAFAEVLKRVEQTEHHKVLEDQLSVRERMTNVLTSLREKAYIEFKQLFTLSEGRMGVVVTFIAILELLKQSLIDIIQTQEHGPIHIKAVVQ